jgi:hypothetical protein
MFDCKKCGHHRECIKKEDWLAEKKEHKRLGCNLQFAPHRGDYILTRPELAEEAKKGREITIAHQLSLENRDDNNPTDESITGMHKSTQDSDENECPV